MGKIISNRIEYTGGGSGNSADVSALEARVKTIEDDYVKQGDVPTELPASDVYDWAKAETKPTYTAEQVGADASGTAHTVVSTHNTSAEAHSDIREAITSEVTRAKAAEAQALTDAKAYTDEQIEAHTSNTSNPHQVTKTQVGLSNVENKSSETIRGELTSQNVTNALKYVPAELDENGLVLSSQLPSYVDDVLEFNTVEDFPTPGESGKIYVATTRNLSYRWGGSDYVTITSDIALGETSATAYRGDRGKVAYDHSQQTSGNPHKVTKSDVGLDNVDNTSDADKPISTATQAALDDLAEGIDDVLYKANESEQAGIDGEALNYVMESDLNNIIAPPYDATKAYFTGNYCMKDNILYKCRTDITTPEQFTASKWVAVTCGNELNNAGLKINTLEHSKAGKLWTMHGEEGTSVSITDIYETAWEYYVLFTDANNVTTEFLIPWGSFPTDGFRIFVKGYKYDDKYYASHSIYVTKDTIQVHTPWTRVSNNGAITNTGTITVHYR